MLPIPAFEQFGVGELDVRHSLHQLHEFVLLLFGDAGAAKIIIAAFLHEEFDPGQVQEGSPEEDDENRAVVEDENKGVHDQIDR